MDMSKLGLWPFYTYARAHPSSYAYTPQTIQSKNEAHSKINKNIRYNQQIKTINQIHNKIYDTNTNQNH